MCTVVISDREGFDYNIHSINLHKVLGLPDTKSPIRFLRGLDKIKRAYRFNRDDNDYISVEVDDDITMIDFSVYLATEVEKYNEEEKQKEVT